MALVCSFSYTNDLNVYLWHMRSGIGTAVVFFMPFFSRVIWKLARIESTHSARFRFKIAHFIALFTCFVASASLFLIYISRSVFFRTDSRHTQICRCPQTWNQKKNCEQKLNQKLIELRVGWEPNREKERNLKMNAKRRKKYMKKIKNKKMMKGEKIIPNEMQTKKRFSL